MKICTVRRSKWKFSSMKNKSFKLDVLQTHLSKDIATGMPGCKHKNHKSFTHGMTVLHGIEDSYSQTLAEESRLGAYKQKL